MNKPTEQIISDYLALSEKATPGPFINASDYRIVAQYRESGQRLARALRVAMDQLRFIDGKNYRAAKEAEINRILNGEQP